MSKGLELLFGGDMLGGVKKREIVWGI